MLKTYVFAATLCLACSLASRATAEVPEVLYDHTIGIDSGGSAGTLEIGHNIHLEQDSTITEIAVSMGSGPSFTVYEDLQLRLYIGEGMNEPPSQLLWAGIIPDVALTRQIQVFSIDVPNVEVPAQFFWSVEPLRKTYSSILHFSLPRQQFGINGASFLKSEDQWELHFSTAFYAVRFMGYETVPEPSALLLGALASIGILIWRRRIAN